MTTVEHSLGELVKSIQTYSKVNTKLTGVEALQKQIGKLSYALSQELRGITPPKGSIRAAGMAALKSGKGIKVRQSVVDWALRKYGEQLNARTKVKGKRRGNLLNANKIGKGGKVMNIQALMVRRELGVRESARNFLSVGARFRGGSTMAKSLTQVKSLGWYEHALGEAGITLTNDEAVLKFAWNPGVSEQSDSVAQGLTKQKGQQAIIRAINSTRADIEAYISRKQNEALGAAINK